MVRRLLSTTALALSACMASAAHAAAPACAERLLPPSPGAATGQRAITARDLIELRDFGKLSDHSRSHSFRLSPDGKFAALILRRADTASNSYCFGVMLVPLDGRTPPRLLDSGGDFIATLTDPYGASGVPSGLPMTEAPVWSPDGRSLAYLRRDRGNTRIWRVDLDGSPARPVAQPGSAPQDLAWSIDGRHLLFTTRSGYEAGLAEIEREGRAGFLYDTRFWALAFARPTPRLPIPFETNALDLATGRIRIVTAGEADAMKGARTQGAGGAQLRARSASGVVAWAEPDPARPRSAPRLLLARGDRPIRCVAPICAGPVGGLWWLDDTTLLILRTGNAANGGRSAVYRWRVERDAEPRKVLETDDWLAQCALTEGTLICARETATAPRTLVRIDPVTGHSATLFDPNPETAGWRFGQHARLVWSDSNGVRSYGDLTLPPDHRPGAHHPLIIVQYLSRGFQRGGLGDEYPIQLLAARGYAVLNFHAPQESDEAAAAPDAIAAQRIKVQDWSGRRRILTALEAGVDTAIALGVVDSARIGITGLSDGASTVQFALNNSDRFKAAIVASCCDEPSAVFSVGPAYGGVVAQVGYPPAGEDGRAFWQAQSLAMNAHRIRVPLLMNLADAEFRMAQETFSALRAHDAPVEMYVFEDEWHTKQHPAHRLAIYERNLAWFDFWLRGVETPHPPRDAEIVRWAAMRSVNASRR